MRRLISLVMMLSLVGCVTVPPAEDKIVISTDTEATTTLIFKSDHMTFPNGSPIKRGPNVGKYNQYRLYLNDDIVVDESFSKTNYKTYTVNVRPGKYRMYGSYNLLPLPLGFTDRRVEDVVLEPNKTYTVQCSIRLKGFIINVVETTCKLYPKY